MSSGGSGVDYAYDALGRVTSESAYGRTLAYQYDLGGNRVRLTFGDANYIQYTYDPLSRMDQVRENGATTGVGVLADYAYDPLSRRTGVVYGNGSAASFTYGATSQDWDLNNDLTGGTTDDVRFYFTINPARQIVQRAASPNPYAWTAPTVSRSYTPNGLNQYSSVGGTSFTYDGRGNLTSDGARSFTYDLENRLLNVSGSASMTLTYDPLGRLLTTTTGGATTTLLYSGDQLVAELNGSGTITARYAHGASIDEPIVWYDGADFTTRKFLIRDNQGSIIAANGSSTVRYTYGPYGEPGSWSGERFRYTGQAALPEVALYHYKARAYDPVLGRFLQTDPVGYDNHRNLYSYVVDDPLNRRDPRGLTPVCVTVGPFPPFCLPDSDAAPPGPANTDYWAWARGIPARTALGFLINAIAFPPQTDACDVIYTSNPQCQTSHNESADEEDQPDERDLVKVPDRDANDVAQEAGYDDAHDAKAGRGEGGVNIYRDRSTGRYWLWDGAAGSEKEPL